MPLLDSFEEDGERALNALVKDCASDSACSKAFSHLDRDVQEVRRQLTDSFHVIGIQFLQYLVVHGALPSAVRVGSGTRTS